MLIELQTLPPELQNIIRQMGNNQVLSFSDNGRFFTFLRKENALELMRSYEQTDVADVNDEGLFD